MISSSLDRLRLQAGALLFKAGDIGDAAYLIESGALEIFLDRPDGDLVLARRGPGEIVGEMAILDHQARSACARAAEDTSLIILTEDQLAHRIEQTDPILRMCLGVVIQRYRETVSMLERVKGVTAVEPPSRPVPSNAAMLEALKTLVLEREIKMAIERGEFELFFQPIVRLKSSKLVGFEALMRWRHPERGLIPPIEFIPAAEASGLIADLTSWAFSEVGRVMPKLMAAAAENPEAVEGPLFMSVNVSGHDLSRGSMKQEIETIFADTGLHPSSLKLEVTESILMKDPERAAAALTACRDGGIGIAIDDFGTGYSSLSYLATLPITTLKIDRAFVRAMLTDPKSMKIVHTILRLADELALPVVAEGIEQLAEAEALNDMGCAFGQGYFFGRPSPFSESHELIRGWVPIQSHTTQAVA